MKQKVFLFLIFISFQAFVQHFNHKEVEKYYKQEVNDAQSINSKIIENLKNEKHNAVIGHFSEKVLSHIAQWIKSIN